MAPKALGASLGHPGDAFGRLLAALGPPGAPPDRLWAGIWVSKNCSERIWRSKPRSGPRSWPGSQESTQNDLSRVKSLTRLAVALQHTRKAVWRLALCSAHAPPGGKPIPSAHAVVARRVACVCIARAAGVGLRAKVREKGQCVGVHTSEMRDRAGVRGLGGGRRTISFVSRAVDEDGAQDQGLRPKGSRSVPCGAHKQARAHSHTLTSFFFCNLVFAGKFAFAQMRFQYITP